MPRRIDASELHAEIRRFICEAFLVEDPASLHDGSSLLAGGILDSTGVLELVAHLEETYGFRIQDEEIIPDNLDSVRSICAFVYQRTSG